MMKILIILVLFLASCKFAEKETYILPKGFIGNVIIFTNIKNGDAKKYDEQGRRLYIVKASGLLLSRFRETYGVIDKRFVYGDQAEIYSEIKGVYFQYFSESLDTQQVYAFYGRDATVEFPESKDTVGVQVLTICKPRDFGHFKNDLFAKKILEMNFLPQDLNYRILTELKNRK